MTALRRLYRVTACAALLAGTVLSASCTGSATGTVKGKITVNGQPLPDGLITFESEVGNKDPFSAAVKDGAYETGPIPVGLCKVSVIQNKVPRPAAPGNDLVPVANPRDRAAVTVPPKYGRSDTSGLTFDVKAGPNTFDKDLTP
jgi:hypothetical protein